MELAHRWGDRNLTRLELVIALLVLAILIGVFSRYVLVVFSRAEQSMINSTVININTALYYRAAMAVMRREYEELEFLEKSNPMENLQTNIDVSDMDMVFNDMHLSQAIIPNLSIANYGGVTNAYTLQAMEKGKWYFNQDNQYLIYIVSNSEFFSTELDGRPRIRFRITMQYEDNNFNGRFDPDIDEFLTMKLQSVDHYKWNY